MHFMTNLLDLSRDEKDCEGVTLDELVELCKDLGDEIACDEDDGSKRDEIDEEKDEAFHKTDGLCDDAHLNVSLQDIQQLIECVDTFTQDLRTKRSDLNVKVDSLLAASVA